MNLNPTASTGLLNVHLKCNVAFTPSHLGHGHLCLLLLLGELLLEQLELVVHRQGSAGRQLTA